MGELLITLFFLAGVFFGLIVYWMRIQMGKLGYHYPIFNSSLRMITDFNTKKSSNKSLKKKYNKVFIIVILLWITSSIGLWLLFK